MIYMMVAENDYLERKIIMIVIMTVIVVVIIVVIVVVMVKARYQ